MKFTWTDYTPYGVSMPRVCVWEAVCVCMCVCVCVWGGGGGELIHNAIRYTSRVGFLITPQAI